MYKVKVENVCRCFLKSGMAENLDFDTEDKAKEKAQKMIEKMQANFCKKHEFSINEQFGDFTIYIKDRV
ncbi:hypothetical protein [Sulfurimonas sp.]|uniref:hypothetical protein n=1 Tax=Sulfurimonas sp. TaxID=2022749 RepID=UPI0025D96E81|nr:hypothetical protein [Sulfurimonas sp.]